MRSAVLALVCATLGGAGALVGARAHAAVPSASAPESGSGSGSVAAVRGEARDVPDVHPDLGLIRYHDPSSRRELWLGLRAGGIAIPASLSPIDRRVWLAHVTPEWALALLPRFTIGGRHGLTVYDAQNIRLVGHGHLLEASARLMDVRPRLVDRVSFGVEVHRIERTIVEGVDFRVGGIRDTVMHVGYGLEHTLAPWLRLGWRASFRHVWVFVNTQRQLRGSVRAAFLPARGHRVAVELVGFYVNRDPRQAGSPLRRNTVNGQVVGEYAWMSAAGVGVVVGARWASSFLSGEAAIYEVREESLNADYGEVDLGVRFVWK